MQRDEKTKGNDFAHKYGCRKKNEETRQHREKEHMNKTDIQES